MPVSLLILLIAILLAVRIPVAFAFIVPSLLYLGLEPGLSIGVAAQRIVSGVDVFVLLAVPLYILAGNLMNSSGITDKVYGFVHSLVGHVRGGLGYVNILGSLIFSGMSGSAMADAAGVGLIEYKAMTDHGYPKKLALGVTAGSSIIGPIMPPSIPAVIYGAAASVSVGQLFVAGVVPAFLLTFALTIAVYIHMRKIDIQGRADRPSLRHVLRSAIVGLPALLVPVIILGGIISGLFTPTEAAAVAVVYTLFLAIVVYRSFGWAEVRESLVATVEMTSAILFIVASVSILGWILAREGTPALFADTMLSITENPVVFLLLANVILLLIGMVLEPTPAMLILIPVFLPTLAEFGIDPVHFGVIMILNLMIGMLTPPVGNILFILSAVTDNSFEDVTRGTLPYVIPLAAVLLVITLFPVLSTGLGTWVGG